MKLTECLEEVMRDGCEIDRMEGVMRDGCGVDRMPRGSNEGWL